MKKWMINHNGYKKACNKIVSAMQPYIDYVIYCDAKPNEKYNCITLSVDPTIKGVKISVSEAEGENQSILIAGENEAHLFYAACDFKTKFVPYAATLLKYRRDNAPRIFDEPLPAYDRQSVPKIGQRGIWTWGHTIYDYRRMIDKMAETKMNTLIIWNDFVPTNIDDVIAYAHENYMKIYLGYAWGWTTHQCSGITDISDAALTQMKDGILQKFKDEYAPIDCDGIYFQSFTERSDGDIGGRRIAEAVTTLVNMAANEILAIKPNLQLQFGLHATSVLKSLDDIANIDPRISIIWEDVGAFPWNYYPEDMEGYEETIERTKAIQSLRQKGGFGGVLKGYINLDWYTFEHHDGPCPIGISTEQYQSAKSAERQAYKRFFLAGWLQKAPKALELVKTLPYDAVMTVLVEDACYEDKLHFPVALYAEMLWDYDREIGDLMYEVALNPAVDF